MKSKIRSLLMLCIGVVTALSTAILSSPVRADGPINNPNAADRNVYYTFTQDWGDNKNGGSICNGCSYSYNTNLVVLWQTILWVDRFLTSESEIDGQFGPKTASATVAWQKAKRASDPYRYGYLAADGQVGPKTWGAADDMLFQPKPETPSDCVAKYNGGGDAFICFAFSNDTYVFTKAMLDESSSGVDARSVYFGGTVDQRKVWYFKKTTSMS